MKRALLLLLLLLFRLLVNLLLALDHRLTTGASMLTASLLPAPRMPYRSYLSLCQKGTALHLRPNSTAADTAVVAASVIVAIAIAGNAITPT
jgi:hypothetical protein